MTNEKLPARCFAVLGTGSDVGKSIVVAALCRIFSDMGIRVVPFKAQNMSNNSYVTPLGGEMGRAQVVQAEAARVPIHVDMNPVLLKPSTNTGSQVVVLGKPMGNREASNYFDNTDYLFGEAKKSLVRLRDQYDLIVMEGAGSCGEVNLQARDFVNFRMARYADAPVILVADIDRGGVFAQIIGTLAVIPPENKQQVKGLIINRFRGDASLFKEGIDYIENATGLPLLGLIPYFKHIEIDSEDGVVLDIVLDPSGKPEPDKINLAVIRFPHISNFTDFAPLSRESIVNLHYLSKPRDLGNYDAVILPGTKNVRFDRSWMKREGWDDCVTGYAHGGGRICGICGGYQMLGCIIRDPHGIEGLPGETDGLGLLNLETVLEKAKTLRRSSGFWKDNGEPVDGYEIHMGITERNVDIPAVIRVESRNGESVIDTDGAVSPDGKIWGSYFHGLFDNPGFRRAFLEIIKPGFGLLPDKRSIESETAFKDHQYNLLADHFKSHLDMENLMAILQLNS